MGTDAELVGIYKIGYDREYNLFPAGFDDELMEAVKSGKGLSTEIMLVYLSQVLKHWKEELEEESDRVLKENIENSIQWVTKTFDKVKKMPDDMFFVSVNEHEGLFKESIEIENYEKVL